MTLSKAEQLREGVPINRLICKKDGTTIGIEYRWNSNERAILWLDGRRKNFVRQPIKANRGTSA